MNLKAAFKEMNIQLHDLLLLVASCFFITYIVFGVQFMSNLDPNNIAFKLPLAVIIFILYIISMGLFIFFEYRRANKANMVVNIVFIVLIALSVLSISIEPNHFSIVMPNSQMAVFDFAPIHYVFFIFYITMFLIAIYVVLFILPKKYQNKTILLFFNCLAMVFAIVSILYSYIAEYNVYIPFLKALFSGDIITATEVAPKSFEGHRNVYGIVLLFAIVCALINHMMSQRKRALGLAAFFFINMIFTLCKTGLAIAAIASLVYFVYRMIITFKDKKRRNITLSSIVGGLILIFGVLTIISVATKGAFLKPIYSLFATVEKGETINSRSLIINNVFALMNQNIAKSILLGRGFGMINNMLYPMNVINGDPVFPIHNGYIALLGQGGIPYIAGFLTLLGYTCYIVVKDFKKDKNFFFATSLSLLVFLIYSLMESLYFMTFYFMFFIYTYHHHLTKGETHDA